LKMWSLKVLEKSLNLVFRIEWVLCYFLKTLNKVTVCLSVCLSV